MKTIKAAVFLLLCSSHISLGQEDITTSDPYLSFKYVRGPHLVYDCKDKHWVCTGASEFNNCKKSRDFEIIERKDELSCIPSKVFSSEKDCVDSQKRIINASLMTRLCDHPNIQKDKKFDSIN